MSGSVQSRPLNGLRTVDLSTTLVGSFASALLGDFGADVVVVEDTVQGNPLRRIPPFYNGSSLLWAVEGRNKQSVSLDLEKGPQREPLAQLLQAADVVIEDRGPGVLESWGFGYEELKRSNPGLVLVRISPFGQTGPYRNRPGDDLIAEAMGGLSSLTP